jgi:hypothetical protein
MLIVTRLMNDHIDNNNDPLHRDYATTTFTFLCMFSPCHGRSSFFEIRRTLSDGLFGMED